MCDDVGRLTSKSKRSRNYTFGRLSHSHLGIVQVQYDALDEAKHESSLTKIFGVTVIDPNETQKPQNLLF